MISKYILIQTFFMIITVSSSFSSKSENYQFDTRLIDSDGDKNDISALLNDEAKPGKYTVDIFINNNYINTEDIDFINYSDGQGKIEVLPCLKIGVLEKWGMNMDKVNYLKKPSAGCVLLKKNQIKMHFSFNSRTLKLTIPQLFLLKSNNSISDVKLWDDGIPAIFLNYNVGEKVNTVNSAHYRSTWANLRPGFNIGPWRFRNSSTIDKNSFTATEWRNVSNYLERGFYQHKSRLVLGQKMTPSDIFNSIPFTGIMLGTDDGMIPFSDKQYSPVVTGIARTSARVEVKQNGYTVYNSNVPPGPFEITEINQIQSGGNLEVIVWESDGHSQQYTVPYQVPAIALHQGYLNYNIMSGHYHSANLGNQDLISQLTLMYGFPFEFSGYGGVQFSKKFNSVSLGIGKSLGNFGALSIDSTLSAFEYNHQKITGNMWRLRYNNTIEKTNTSYGVTHSFLSNNYLDANTFFEGDRYNSNSLSESSMSTSVQLSQSLNRLGALTLSLQTSSNKKRYDTDNYRLSWSRNFKYFNLTADWQNNKTYYTRKQFSSRENLFSILLTVPLDSWFENNLQATWSFNTKANASQEQQYGLQGQSFDKQLAWGVNSTYQSSAQTDTQSSLNLDWSGAYGKVRGNYSYGRGSQDLGVDIEGSIILHGNGLTIGQSFSDSVVLTEVLGASGVAVGGWPGIKTDFRGYTVLPNLNNYQRNRVYLNAATVPRDAEVLNTENYVIPTAGSIVKAKFVTHIGFKALVKIQDKQGKNLPLGSRVYVKGQPAIAGLTDGEGKVYLSGLKKDAQLIIHYQKQTCEIQHLDLIENSLSYLQQIDVKCS